MCDLFRSSKSVLLGLIAAALSAGIAAAQEGFEGWNLEPGVAQAHLVMVARVTSISQLTVVEGAKTDISLREYRFQPVRKLKGIFQRDQLSMTATYVDAAVRQEAFAVAKLLRGERYAKLLADLADQAELEGTPLLSAAEEEMRRPGSFDR